MPDRTATKLCGRRLRPHARRRPHTRRPSHVHGRKAARLATRKQGVLMTRISFLYPKVEGARFDFNYYVEKHMPWSIKLLSAHAGFKGVSVERGISSGFPGTEPTYTAI